MTQVGSVYAEALYDLAREEGLTGDVLMEMKALKEIFAENKDFLRLLSTPSITKAERCGILDETFRGKVHQYVLNFLKILMEKGYLRWFDDCCEAYRGLYNEEMGILPVCVMTAIPLTEEQTARLSDKLSSLTGKTIELDNRVDPSCIGGVRLEYDGKLVDGTIQHRLDAVRSLLKNTML